MYPDITVWGMFVEGLVNTLSPVSPPRYGSLSKQCGFPQSLIDIVMSFASTKILKLRQV